MNRFTVFLNGELEPTERFFMQIADSKIIAADGGVDLALSCGVIPDLWIGDFDSVAISSLETLRSIPRITFPIDKDKTDGELAVLHCLSSGADSIILAGAFGKTRIDHILSHFSLALSLAQKGRIVLLSSGFQEGVPLLPGLHKFDYSDKTIFSILPFSSLEGLSIFGARWELERVNVAFGSTCTLSNEVKGDLEISIESGLALLIVFLV